MLSALRHADRTVLGHMMGEEKSNEIPAAPALIEALGFKGCVFTLDAERCQKKRLQRVIASGDHLLVQVKANQPSLRRKLEHGASWRKPLGDAISQAQGHNRWESRELAAFPAKARFRRTAWEDWIKTVLRLELTVHKRDPKTGLLIKLCETVLRVSPAEGFAPERWGEWIRGRWRIENASHYVRDVAFAEDASRIRKNPDVFARLRSFAYNFIQASGEHNIQYACYRDAFDLAAAIKIANQ